MKGVVVKYQPVMVNEEGSEEIAGRLARLKPTISSSPARRAVEAQSLFIPFFLPCPLLPAPLNDADRR